MTTETVLRYSLPYTLIFTRTAVSPFSFLMFFLWEFTSFVYREGKEMESKKQNGSCSSFTAHLFGSKESSPSSKGIFSSIFPPPSMVGGRNSSSSQVLESWPKQPLEGSDWRHGMQAPLAESATYTKANKDSNSVFQEERMEPFHLSSSLYYGGRDIYRHSSSTQTSTSYPIFKKDGEHGPNGSNSQDASTGNWWQGSVYY
ncbi:hypothetical protein E1A91_D07G116400v1 [Gossypium mustelinum]|uniref:Uncharacterized protein n=1 Tax=Gossypium mustelinum TaxID=34275 RepID=A0A5D2U9F0_GOSMU|nr:hypothetical protein E1A91_D07G116400v1 [Gossypium mustelinum]